MLTGVDVKMPQPRKALASKPATPALKSAGPEGPASWYLIFSSGATAMYKRSCGGTMSIFGVTL